MINQNTYRRPAPRGWRERWMQRFGMNTMVAPLRQGELTVPNWLTGKAMAFFFLAMFACWGAFGHVPTFELILVSSISVVLFFYGGVSLSKSWNGKKEKSFVWNLIVVGFIIRMLWVLYLYFYFYPDHFSNTYGDPGDVEWYMPFGQAIAKWISEGFPISFSHLQHNWLASIDDTGYPMWLGIIYFITDNSSDVFIPYVIKCVLGAYCAILIYNISKRHFGMGAARMAAIFVCLNPNMIYWCGTMLKETEMIFLVCLAIDNFDRVLTSGKRFTFMTLLPGLLAATALMFFRTALGMVIFLAVFAHIIMASQRVMSVGKKILAGVLVGLVLVVSMGDRIRTESQSLLSAARSGQQESNMEWRAQRVDSGGRKQSFARYAGKAVFAPLIFTIPFPTFNQADEGQIIQMQLAGGNYIKNILSFFVIILMLMMLISGEWRRHVFILAYTMGYLVVLVMSTFAQSGRFHMPVMPLLILFGAYGVQIAKSNKRLRNGFTIALVIEVVACVAWNWFKLKGRGMI